MTELDRMYAGLRVSAERNAAAGRPVIGIVGRDVPSLLIAATGAQPFRIPPEQQPTDVADALMGRAVDRAASLVLAGLLAGSLDFLSGIFLSHDSEASVRLFYTAQELHRRGRIVVPVHLVDQVHLDRESTLRFNAAQIARMWSVATEWSASPIDAASLETAKSELAEVRGELTRLRDGRRTGTARASGVAALQCYAVASAVPPAQALPLLRSEGSATVDDGLLPVFLTGSAPIGDELYRAIEDAGAVVVGEDHDWGDPILSDLLPEVLTADRDAMSRELALSRLHGAPAAASSSMAARAEATRGGILASGARALLSIVRDHDDAPAWDWKRQSARAGVPGVQLRGPGTSDIPRIADVVAELRSAS
jgi:hypothetical protein